MTLNTHPSSFWPRSCAESSQYVGRRVRLNVAYNTSDG